MVGCQKIDVLVGNEYSLAFSGYKLPVVRSGVPSDPSDPSVLSILSDPNVLSS